MQHHHTAILCIPGTWKDRSEIVTRLAQDSQSDYLFAGVILLNQKTEHKFILEFCEKDDRMRDSFRMAGVTSRLSDEFLDEIDQHNSVVYLSYKCPDLEDLKALSDASSAILEIGGIGIKVETTGKAFSSEQWNRFLDNFDESNLYTMYVQDCISDGKCTYSCGMHNLGLKDTIVYSDDFQESQELISAFGRYQVIDKPTINPNQTFSKDADSDVYLIVEETQQPNIGHELFHNPYGMWRLEKVTSQSMD